MRVAKAVGSSAGSPSASASPSGAAGSSASSSGAVTGTHALPPQIKAVAGVPFTPSTRADPASGRPTPALPTLARPHSLALAPAPALGARGRLLWASCHVMNHEIGHMFNFMHCVHFHCRMNGANTLEEGNDRPPDICPICLRKLQAAVRFDCAERYRALADTARGFCEELGDGRFARERPWFEAELERFRAKRGWVARCAGDQRQAVKSQK